jgi:hypothetical protein
MVKFDAHRFLLTNVSAPANRCVHRIQAAQGEDPDAAITAGAYTEVMIAPETDARSAPFDVQSRRVLAGTKLWVRAWCDGGNASTLTMFFGIHEYDE